MQVYPTFKDFDPSEPISRVDTLLYEHMAGDKQQAKVSVECGQITTATRIVMSHGQSTVNRGFSVNKEVAVENFSDRLFIAQRIIHGHIESVGGLVNWHI